MASNAVAEGGDTAARQANLLRQSSFGLGMMLIVELALGIGVNIFVTVPKDYQGHGMGAAFGDALSKGPAALIIHAIVGLLLIIASIALLVRAIIARRRLMIVTGAIALLAIIGAANSGANFVNTGDNAATMTMGMLTVVALACAFVNLFALSRPVD
jgi:hypothetical protein